MNKQKQQTNGNRSIWLVCRTDTNAPGFWLVKRTLGYKNFVPEELSRNQPILRFDGYTTTRLANQTMSFTYEGFLWRENEESMFWSFYPLADKTNNDHLPKPFFKVIRKSLILQRKRHRAQILMRHTIILTGGKLRLPSLIGSNCFPYQNFKKWRKTPLDQTLSYSTWGWVTLNTKASFSINALLTLWSAGVLTIYMENPKIPVGKSNGSCHSTLFSLLSWFGL